LTEEDWNRLFTLAAQHGVTALLFDMILRLPEQQQPSRALKIRWALSSEAIEKRHAQQTRAAHELTTLFASHGVRTILLKGLGLSIYYPRPEHRECG
ncbi:nucleotidyltransferase family protein, partial [Alistipes putredinis]|uniref:nucleotidyltransferase family protein n=1 Tax=Alistipes putredinis TaxID=28117 RepID=UPI0023B0EB97